MNENYRKKKQPELLRAQVLEAAAQVASECGLVSMSLNMVARRAGISKGGLIHHFPSRQDLVMALFHKLLAEFEAGIREFAAQDENPRGRFLRAYVRATVLPLNKPWQRRLLGSFALDGVLAAEWRDWLQKQMEDHEEKTFSVSANLVRYAADGLWLEDCSGNEVADAAERAALVERLIELTYAL